MLFHTPSFALFLCLVFGLHWTLFARSLKGQNLLLIIASYVFYASWDYRFLGMLFLSTLIDYLSGIRIHKSKNPGQAKLWLGISLLLNLGLLGFFKYYNFFVDSFCLLLQSLHVDCSPAMIQIILPVGISFYTFHGMSYVFDIYRGKVSPTYDFVQYSLFVCFFPLLVAGPIERATHLLPQLGSVRSFRFEEGLKGMKQILWGLIKKMVIADNCATLADFAFANHQQLPGLNIALGVIFFSFQIYGDFSGYTDIAIGTGRLFGIELLRNFAYPYFASSIHEFWRRWHISLSSWFRDYLYIPLGGSRGSKYQTYRNTFLVFAISGFWHGANFTFLIWGLLHFLYFLPHLWSEPKQGPAKTDHIPSILGTFLLVSFAWIFFRAPNLQEAIALIQDMFSHSWLVNPFAAGLFRQAALVLLLIAGFMAMEWTGRKNEFAIEQTLSHKPIALQYLFHGFLVFLLLMYMKTESSPFIYFQF